MSEPYLYWQASREWVAEKTDESTLLIDAREVTAKLGLSGWSVLVCLCQPVSWCLTFHRWLGYRVSLGSCLMACPWTRRQRWSHFNLASLFFLLMRLPFKLSTRLSGLINGDSARVLVRGPS